MNGETDFSLGDFSPIDYKKYCYGEQHKSQKNFRVGVKKKPVKMKSVPTPIPAN